MAMQRRDRRHNKGVGSRMGLGMGMALAMVMAWKALMMPHDRKARRHVAQATLGSANISSHPTVYDLLYTYHRPSAQRLYPFRPLNLWLNLAESEIETFLWELEYQFWSALT